MKNLKKKGFTLAEVLVVLTIIGVTATMTVPTLMKNITKSRVESQINTIYSKLASAVAPGYATGEYATSIADAINKNTSLKVNSNVMLLPGGTKVTFSSDKPSATTTVKVEINQSVANPTTKLKGDGTGNCFSLLATPDGIVPPTTNTSLEYKVLVEGKKFKDLSANDAASAPCI